MGFQRLRFPDFIRAVCDQSHKSSAVTENFAYQLFRRYHRKALFRCSPLFSVPSLFLMNIYLPDFADFAFGWGDSKFFSVLA
jgi:hypothetical protein